MFCCSVIVYTHDWNPTQWRSREKEHVVSTQLPNLPPSAAYKQSGVTSTPGCQIGLCHTSKPPVEPIVPPGCFVYQQRLGVYTPGFSF